MVESDEEESSDSDSSKDDAIVMRAVKGASVRSGIQERKRKKLYELKVCLR